MRFDVETESRTDVLDVTDRVAGALPDDHDGTATVFVRHTTAGVAINEAESRLLSDVASFVESLAPDSAERSDGTRGSSDERSESNGGWRHDELDDNADAHLRALLLGPSSTVPVRDGTLDLGRWQSVLLVECDGPRARTVDVVV